MQIVIVGAGALGSIYAGYLARAGHEVKLVARGDRARALRDHGLTIEGQDAFRVRCDIVTDPATLRSTDLVIVAVKTYDTAAALDGLRGLEVDAAFSIQNGVLKNQQLADAFGQEAVIGAVGMLGGQVQAPQGDRPGVVRYNLPGPTRLGESGRHSNRAGQITQVLEQAGLMADTADDITAVEWSKFVGWSGVSALAALTRLPTWQFLADPESALLAARIMRETAAVAKAQGIALVDSGNTSVAFLTGSERDAVATLQQNGERMRSTAPDFRQSMLQDVLNAKRLEVDETLGYSLTLAQEHDLEVPTLAFCTAVLRTLSRVNGPV
ncbi:MAG: 2-dehydropantoate 2-reductase [Proteobacteria bacterium]|jgi:2-dehydropantoate 2-reductase|nr:2-dehydropantoate 2-reductase [Pseudomonadota bacterium]